MIGERQPCNPSPGQHFNALGVEACSVPAKLASATGQSK